MDDLISRQSAIDALNDEFTIIGKTNAIVVQDYIRRVINRLHSLPSAQQWIPCSERLPEYDGEMYLVTDYCEQINRRRIHVSYCYVNREGFWSDVPMGYKVIAWMPLPEPWKGENNGI